MKRKSLDRLLEWWLRGERRKEASRDMNIYLSAYIISIGRYSRKEGREAKG